MADRAGEALAGVVDAITREMETFSGVRDDMLVRSRSLIRDCAHSIRAMHRHELEEAERMLAAARQDAQAMVEPLAAHPDLYHSGSTQDALKELVEAHLLYGFITGDPAGDAGGTGGDGGDLSEGADRGGDGDAAFLRWTCCGRTGSRRRRPTWRGWTRSTRCW